MATSFHPLSTRIKKAKPSRSGQFSPCRGLRRFIAACLLVLCGLWASGTAPAQTSTLLDPAHLGNFFDAFMGRHLAENHIAGATVAVVQDGQLVFARGYGYADLAAQTPVDPATTLFRVGSMVALFYALRFWWRGEGQIGPRIHYSLTTLAAIALVWVLGYWNLLGWRF